MIQFRAKHNLAVPLRGFLSSIQYSMCTIKLHTWIWQLLRQLYIMNKRAFSFSFQQSNTQCVTTQKSIVRLQDTELNVTYTKGLCFLLSISSSTHNYITQALFGCLPPIAEVLSCVVPSFSSVYTRGKHGLHYLHITYSMEYTIHLKITECEVLI